MKRYIRSSQKCKICASTTYDDRITYPRGRYNYSVYTAYADDPDYFQCQITEIHPYDDADYFWAKKDQPASATIYQKGIKKGTMRLPEWDEDEYETVEEYIGDVVDRICIELRHRNAKIEPRMMHN